MGNSEVGHMSLGSGRVVSQNISRIDQAIAEGSFNSNPAYVEAIDKANAAGGNLHIFGLLSPGGVHSHEHQIAAAIKLAAERGTGRVYVHAFLDGRDTPPRSAASSLHKVDSLLSTLGCGRIASVVGRYYAMDRDNRWDRVEAAYRLLTEASAEFTANSAEQALQAAYDRGENDEFVKATVVRRDGDEEAVVGDNDAVLFMNFRADRARQLTRAFIEPDFSQFQRRTVPALADFVMTTEYSADIDAPVAFPPESLDNVLGDHLSQLGKTQLRMAETEKYAHVTFFFSGGREAPFDGEQRVMIPSPDVATYDLQPEMSAAELTDKLVEAIHSSQYDFIVCNYANGDMVGHTGVYDAAVKAVEALDSCLGRIEAALLEVDGQALITADHGNCEQMSDYESGQNHTQHTTEHVPLVYVGKRALTLDPAGGKLADIAPTLLAMMGLPQPIEMTGKNLSETPG
jgi:2,3-bisphosphoglycerate-independent phosphoglycerate mutase